MVFDLNGHTKAECCHGCSHPMGKEKIGERLGNFAGCFNSQSDGEGVQLLPTQTNGQANGMTNGPIDLPGEYLFFTNENRFLAAFGIMPHLAEFHILKHQTPQPADEIELNFHLVG